MVEIDPDRNVPDDSKVLGDSDIFGLGPNEWYKDEREPATIFRLQFGPVPPGWLRRLETTVYVRCAENLRSINYGSTQEVVTLPAFQNGPS